MPGIQIGGLASGMDTESIITQLMQLERQPETRMTQQKTISAAREQGLKDVLTRVKNLQTAASDLKSVGTWADTQSVDSSDNSKLGVTRTGGAGPGGYTVSVSQLASSDQWTYKYTPPAADTSFQITTASGQQTVNLAAGLTLDQAVGAINSDVDSKVYAINVNGRLALSSRDTGGTAAFSVTPVSGTDALDDAVHTRTAVDAQYSLDGGVTTLTSASNYVKNGIPGIDLTLKSLIPPASQVTVNVGNPGPDQSAIKDKVKAFVDQYNSTIDFIRSKTSEQKVKTPTTTAELTQGVLFNDSGLNGILSRLRTTIGSSFDTGDSTTDQLSELGISTGAASVGAINQDSVAGKLTLDDAKLSAALASSPISVRKLLGGTSTTTGLAQTFQSMLDPLTKDQGDFASRIDSAEKEQKDYQSQVDTLETRLTAKEAMLRAQFTAMETAIQNSQTMQSALAKQLG
jgi:flagellar hook-associated protein 2